VVEHVLVVDDDSNIRAIIAEALEREGYDVETASNGAEALEAIQRQEPSTILLDMHMPVLDGWGVASTLQQLGLRVPTLVMTAAATARKQADEIAAAGFLAKPFDLDDLVRAVERVCPA
jgi:two-component system, OmpR family, response regulator MprA